MPATTRSPFVLEKGCVGANLLYTPLLMNRVGEA